MSEGPPPNAQEKLLTTSFAFATLALLLFALVWIWPNTFFLFSPQSSDGTEEITSGGLNEAEKDQVRLAMMERLREYQKDGIQEDEKQNIRQQLLDMQESTLANALTEVEKEQIRAQLRTN